MYLLIVVLVAVEFLASCARTEKSTNRSTPVVTTASERVKAHFDEYGFIVSRNSAGESEHLGDSLLWTGLALGLLPCADAKAAEVSLYSMILDTRGGLYRHPEVTSESDDGKFGVYWGLKRYLAHCDTDQNWTNALNSHRQTVGLNLHPMIDDILHDLGQRPALTDTTRNLTTTVVSGWAAADVIQQASAYRIHLGFLVTDQLGTETGRAKFCDSAKGAGMELIQAYCGEPAALRQFVTNFVPNQWEYKLQRSPVWESEPDGNGLDTPGLDLLMAEAFQ